MPIFGDRQPRSNETLAREAVIGQLGWVEKHGVEATMGAGFGPGSMLPEFMLLSLPVLKSGCVKEAGWVGRSISIELGGNLYPRGLVGRADAGGGGGAPGKGAISCWCSRPPFFAMCLGFQVLTP